MAKLILIVVSLTIVSAVVSESETVFATKFCKKVFSKNYYISKLFAGKICGSVYKKLKLGDFEAKIRLLNAKESELNVLEPKVDTTVVINKQDAKLPTSRKMAVNIIKRLFRAKPMMYSFIKTTFTNKLKSSAKHMIPDQMMQRDQPGRFSSVVDLPLKCGKGYIPTPYGCMIDYE